jgi:hypothetical protein
LEVILRTRTATLSLGHIDYYVQFMRKSFINILRRRYGFEFHSSSQVLVENGIEFIPVLVDVKDGFEKFDRLHSKVEKVQ